MDKITETSNSANINTDLWLKFKAGDSVALGQLAQIHYRALYNYATKFSNNPDFIRDCLQELYLELWERRTFLSDTAFVKSYLFKALRHKLIKETARLKRFQEPHEALFEVHATDLPIESHIIETESLIHQNKRLTNVISRLSKRQQEIIYLRFYQNLENEDISNVMGLGRQSVSNLLYKTLKEMKEIWIPVEFFWILVCIIF